MNRLTERKENNTILVKCCGENCKYNFEYCEERAENCPTFHEIYKKLAYYEDLEEQGKLLDFTIKGEQVENDELRIEFIKKITDFVTIANENAMTNAEK